MPLHQNTFHIKCTHKIFLKIYAIHPFAVTCSIFASHAQKILVWKPLIPVGISCNLIQLSDMKIWAIIFLLHIFVFSCCMQRTGYLRLTRYLQFFYKENVRYPVLICREPISLILQTWFSILGTQIRSLKPGLTWHMVWCDCTLSTTDNLLSCRQQCNKQLICKPKQSTNFWNPWLWKW